MQTYDLTEKPLSWRMTEIEHRLDQIEEQLTLLIMKIEGVLNDRT